MQQHEDPSLFLEEERKFTWTNWKSTAEPDTSVVLTASCLTALVGLSVSVFFQGQILKARAPSVLSTRTQGQIQEIREKARPTCGGLFFNGDSQTK